MRQLAGGWKGVARAVWVVAERNRLQVPLICRRLRHQTVVATNHVKIFTVGEVLDLFPYDSAERRERMRRMSEWKRDGVWGVGRSYPNERPLPSTIGPADVARPGAPHQGAERPIRGSERGAREAELCCSLCF